MELPTKVKAASIEEPRFLIVLSAPKVGKTSNLMQLPNSLLIDLESSGEFYDGMSINVKKEALKEGKTDLAILGSISKLIQEEIKKTGKSPYDFGIIDSATVLEDLAGEYATMLYKNSLVGKNFTGTDVVKELKDGAGYMWLREAFEKILAPYQNLFNKCLILVVHVKDKDIAKDNGTMISVKELNLAGKLKLIIPAKADGVCKMYRKDNKNYLSFVPETESLSFGVRELAPRLNGKEFVISEMKDNKLVTYWPSIFPSIK